MAENFERPRVWLRAFYGFDPEGAGYIGFTHEGQRQSMMDEMRDGDLVLIYGASEDLTERNQRAQALGFLEIEVTPCFDTERMSDEAYAWKVERGFQDRWRFGIKVRRAWRVKNRVHISTIAPTAYDSKFRFERTTKAILLGDEETELALGHPVAQVNVFGEPEIEPAKLGRGIIEDILKPSKGPAPSIGNRTATYVDGDNYLYLMALTAKADAMLPRAAFEFGHDLIKVGRTNNLARRKSELNCGFPQNSTVKWDVKAFHKFPSATEAHDAEEALKSAFAKQFRSQGNEFYTGVGSVLEAAFHTFCARRARPIKGAPGKASGIR